MTKTIKTINSVEPNIQLWEEKYKYQEDLTRQLDSYNDNFDQNMINKIVLWKVSRYAEPNDKILSKINLIKKTDQQINIELTNEILKDLLVTKGFGLPMATTVLRFKNPNIYQLIDQRVYRFIFGEPLPKATKADDLIKTYHLYLDRLKEVCKQYDINFCNSDRILYQADIIENKGIPLMGYGTI
ncbi:MAG: hypothetical protein ACTHPO_12100 [Alphaproteobacteria bacterium]